MHKAAATNSPSPKAKKNPPAKNPLEDVLQIFDWTLLDGGKGIRPGDPLVLECKIENLSTDRHFKKLWWRNKKQGEVLLITPKEPICDDLAPLKTVTAKIAVKVRQPAPRNFSKYPLAIEFELYEDATFLMPLAVILDAALLVRGVKDYKAPDDKPVNILLFGEAGSGKTTLIRTILSALERQIILTGRNTGMAGAFLSHASSNLRLIKLANGLNLLDTWGSEPSNYKGEEFKRLILGTLPLADPKIGQPDMNVCGDPEKLKALPTNSGVRPDVIFICTTQQLIEDASYITRLKAFLKQIQEERPDTQPFLIVNKIDEVDPTLRKEPELDNEILQEKIHKIGVETGVQENNIFPALGYIKERENTVHIDRFVLDLLFTAMSLATQARTQ